MVLSVLSDWIFTPKFKGNENMTLTLHQLSGAEEMKIGLGEDRDLNKWITSVLVKITNPISLNFDDEGKRDMEPIDIVELGVLKELYYEILIEFHKKTTLSL